MSKHLIIGILTIIVAGVAFLGYQTSDSQISPRDAIEEGIASYSGTAKLEAGEQALLRIQLAISDYIANHHQPPDSLEDLQPIYFDKIPLNPSTNKPFRYERNGPKYDLEIIGGSSGQKPASGLAKANGSKKIDEDFINPNTMKMDEFVYDPNGKRDPFIPFTKTAKVEIDESLPPLLRYDLGQLRVAAVLSDSRGGRFAMVEDATGIGFPVKVGDRIGNRQGEVISIEPKTVNVLETYTDALGQIKREQRSIELVSGGAKGNRIGGSKGTKRNKNKSRR